MSNLCPVFYTFYLFQPDRPKSFKVSFVNLVIHLKILRFRNIYHFIKIIQLNHCRIKFEHGCICLEKKLFDFPYAKHVNTSLECPERNCYLIRMPRVELLPVYLTRVASHECLLCSGHYAKLECGHICSICLFCLLPSLPLLSSLFLLPFSLLPSLSDTCIVNLFTFICVLSTF